MGEDEDDHRVTFDDLHPRMTFYSPTTQGITNFAAYHLPHALILSFRASSIEKNGCSLSQTVQKYTRVVVSANIINTVGG